MLVRVRSLLHALYYDDVEKAKYSTAMCALTNPAHAYASHNYYL